MIKVSDSRISSFVEECFPWQTMRAKSKDPLWFSNGIRKKVAQRKSISKLEGQSARWRRMKNLTEEIIKDKKTAYLENVRKRAAKNNNSKFNYNAVKL